jgi:small multidrug resistance pump
MSMTWLVLFGAIAISIVGQTMLKAGAEADTFLHQLLDWRTPVGLGLYGLAAMFYMVALRRIPMSVALPCTATSYVAAALIGHFAFGEPLGYIRIAAIALISGGVVLLVV